MIIGELSALAGSGCWATCSIFFTASARRIGAWSLNFVRLWFALFFLTLALWIWKGSPVPTGATGEDWFWLAISAIVGLVFGDLFYFGALKSIGPRVTMLLFTLAPPVAAVGEWWVYGTPLGLMALSGMIIAMAGVAIVITDRNNNNNRKSPFRISLKGLLLGAAGSICQGLGLVLSKMGLDHVDGMSGTFIRMVVAAPCFTVIYLAIGGKVKQVLRNRQGMAFAMGGAFFGPFLGVTLSLVAVKHTHAGVAMTILSTTPVTVLPYAVLIYKEKLTLRAVAGAFTAVIGVALLCLPEEILQEIFRNGLFGS